MVVLEILVIVLGVLVSFYLKDINFLGLNFQFLNTGLIYPDFMLIFLIFFALRRGELAGIWIGFFAGLLEDAGIISFSASPGDEFMPVIGVHALVYTIFGFAIGRTKRMLAGVGLAPLAVLVFFATFLMRFFIWLIFGLVEDFSSSYAFIGPAFYTAILSPVWFTLLGWLYRIPVEEAE